MVIPILETIVVSARPSGVCLIEFNRLRRGNAFSDQLCRVGRLRAPAYGRTGIPH